MAARNLTSLHFSPFNVSEDTRTLFLHVARDTRNYLLYHVQLLEQSIRNKTFLTGQKMKSSIEDFFSKCGQIRSLLREFGHIY